MTPAEFALQHVKPISACVALSVMLLGAQNLDLTLVALPSAAPLPPSQVIRMYGYPTNYTVLVQVEEPPHELLVHRVRQRFV